MFTDHEDPERDVGKLVVVEARGNRIYIKQLGPHGFWFMTAEKGTLPKKLTSAWTHLGMAKTAAERHLRENGLEVLPDTNGDVGTPTKKIRGLK